MSKVDFHHHHDKFPSSLFGFLFGATITSVVGMTRLVVSQRSSNLVLSVNCWSVLRRHGHGQQCHDLLLGWQDLTWIPVWHQHTFLFWFLFNAVNP
jgi:hypothetical protein